MRRQTKYGLNFIRKMETKAQYYIIHLSEHGRRLLITGYGDDYRSGNALAGYKLDSSNSSKSLRSKSTGIAPSIIFWIFLLVVATSATNCTATSSNLSFSATTAPPPPPEQISPRTATFGEDDVDQEAMVELATDREEVEMDEEKQLQL